VAVKIQVPKKALLVRIVLSPLGKFLIAAFVILFTAALGVATYYYSKYSRMIDAKLRAGAFATTSMLYAGPHSVAVGDESSPTEIAAMLRNSGYTENKNSPMGHYIVRSDAIDVYPGPESFYKREGAVIKFSGKKVRQIISLVDNSQVPLYRLEPELITNLFDKKREKRRIVKFDDVPPVMKNAILAAEDRRFFSHIGFDPVGVMRAAVVDLRARKQGQGASTLTMQLARTLWLDNSRTWRRKVAESLITLHLEQKLSKREIFEYYANSIYLGQRGSFSIHGFGEGAQVYFGKDLQEITLPEAALLAGLVQSPNMRNPFRYPDRAKTRRNTVLGMMREAGFINDNEYERAIETPLKLVGEEVGSSDAPYFVDLVNDELQTEFQDHDFQDSSYRVYTTLDMDLQRDAVAAVRLGMAEVDGIIKKRKSQGPSPEVQCALVAIDPHTGAVKALVGGRNYGMSQLDRVLARRPPGSVFKPFVYTAAMETGLTDTGEGVLTPVTTLMDEPTTFYYDDRTYSPGNFKDKFYGNVTLRFALTHSLNIPTVKVAEKVGYRTVLDLARKAGMTIDAAPTPAIALGSVGVTPLEVAGAYTIYPNNGVWVKPNYLAQIRDQRGTAIYTYTPETRAVLDPRIAFLMTNLLEDVLQTGTGAGVRSRGFTLTAAGKTGTSHDAWFAGYTSKLLCVVWVGYDDYRDVKIEGAKAALPIWTEFMKRAHTHREYRHVTGFEPPEGLVSAEIDPESGQIATNACPHVQTDYFIAGTQPIEACRLHGGNATQVAGWETPAPPAAQNGSASASGPTHAETQRVARQSDPPAPAVSIPVAEPPPTPPPPKKQKKGVFGRIRDIFK
jgi:penicillin-binding protein 1B